MIAFIISFLLDFWQGLLHLIKWGLILLAIFIGFIIFILFLLPLLLQIIGYEVDASGSILGRKAAQEHNVRICNNIIVIRSILGPPTSERIAACIEVYASITHDPSVCELLMPSSYGWDCIGAASDKEPCLMDFQSPPEVRGNGIAVPMSACKDGPKNITNNACCKIANIVFLDKVGTCSSLAESDQFKDQCFHESAIKNIDAVACTSILNSNIRTACEVEVRALKKENSLK